MNQSENEPPRGRDRGVSLKDIVLTDGVVCGAAAERRGITPRFINKNMILRNKIENPEKIIQEVTPDHTFCFPSSLCDNFPVCHQQLF